MITRGQASAWLLAVLGGALVWAVAALAAQKEEVLASNDEGEITLAQPTQAGGLTLPPDTYVVLHRISKGRQFIRFMQVSKAEKLRVTRIYSGWYTDTQYHNAGEVECRVEPLGARVQATTVTIASENGKLRIARVMIKGRAEEYVC